MAQKPKPRREGTNVGSSQECVGKARPARGRKLRELPIIAASSREELVPVPKTILSLDEVAEQIGGREKFKQALMLSNDPIALALANSMNHQPSASIQTLAFGENVDIVKLVGKLAATLYSYNIGVAQLMNGLAQPAVMGASIESAQITGQEGFKDREMQLRMSGLIKDNKSPLVNINVGAGGIESQEEFLKDITDV